VPGSGSAAGRGETQSQEGGVTMADRQDVVATTARHTYATWGYQKGWRPLHVVDAEGSTFTDASGKRYLDFASQLACSNLGHKNAAVIDAICEQARRLPYIGPAFTCDIRAKVSAALAEVMPSGLTKFFFSTSGTEANEAAIKIARLYTGKHRIVARYHSYHGATAASISVSGDFRRWPVEPHATVGGTAFAPDCYCYRCPLHQAYPQCGVACADYVEYMLENEGNVAAVLVEPVVGTNGVLVPPPEYLPRLKRACERHGALLIADEVMSGWGRTGEWFAVNHVGVEPDILTTAKGVTGAYAPLGVTAVRREIAEFFDDHYFAHGHTYEAHPLTLAPALAAIAEYRRLDLVSRAKTMGAFLGERLASLPGRHPSVGDVRGVGLFWAVELVRDRKSREPFNTRLDKLGGKPLVVGRVASEMMRRGVYAMSWVNHIMIAPPLIITEAEIEQGVAALDEALAIADHEVTA
jgi:taurine---2-oxoglutarate transaminase